MAYAPQGAVAAVSFGQVSGGFAGISRTLSYNNRLQISTIQSTSSNGTVQNLAYQYGTSNNGTITSITNNLNTNRTQNFTYDYLNRASTAQTQGSTGSTCWGQSFGYDRYGNFTSATVTKCSAPTLSLTVNGNNQITNTGFAYDSDGNLTGDGALTYSWDAEGRLTSSAGVTYLYDGDGRRVKNSRLYWSGINSAPVAETDLSGNITNEYVFFGGLRIARRDSTGAVFYNQGDHLSTARVITNATGVTQQESDYYPFGGELVITSGSGTSYKFTGYERDSETGLDHTWFRKYSSNIGRWHTPDPNHGNTVDPQSLNRYSYVVNNPANFTDARGLCFDYWGNYYSCNLPPPSFPIWHDPWYDPFQSASDIMTLPWPWARWIGWGILGAGAVWDWLHAKKLETVKCKCTVVDFTDGYDNAIGYQEGVGTGVDFNSAFTAAKASAGAMCRSQSSREKNSSQALQADIRSRKHVLAFCFAISRGGSATHNDD